MSIAVQLRNLSNQAKELEKEVIRRDFRHLKERGVTSEEAFERLKEEHHRSTSSIRHIVYPEK